MCDAVVVQSAQSLCYLTQPTNSLIQSLKNDLPARQDPLTAHQRGGYDAQRALFDRRIVPELQLGAEEGLDMAVLERHEEVSTHSNAAGEQPRDVENAEALSVIGNCHRSSNVEGLEEDVLYGSYHRSYVDIFIDAPTFLSPPLTDALRQCLGDCIT